MMPSHSALESPFLLDEWLAPEPPYVGGVASTAQAGLRSPFLSLSAFEPEDAGWTDSADERFDEEDDRIDIDALAQGEGASGQQDETSVFDDEGEEACAFEGARTCSAAEDGECDDEATDAVIGADEFDADRRETLGTDVVDDEEAVANWSAALEFAPGTEGTIDLLSAGSDEQPMSVAAS